ncbi:cytidine monophosphate-N-acetylneuraminic acid hydroxylase isoform X6 [Trachypithecus francoisi]|uniref:cytidine monophosphate-N-acetylneuraminic acid hydroxylase isoform X6 n=1 Tax=Trachypithecus francoisi TaxID=54180 RepID=UPI00141B513B|nr:cytidine monophosphate-N-acetylneuraminic acid hydroxylase isoform X6 [Trachypithecus francoisi]
MGANEPQKRYEQLLFFQNTRPEELADDGQASKRDISSLEKWRGIFNNTEQTTEILLCLSPVEVANLKEGINFFRNKSTGKDYILYKSKSRLRACKNVCKHQGGLFIKDIEDLAGRSVRCTKHNWKLDVSTMKYINPPESFCQDELVVEMDENNGLLLLELNPPNPWDSEPRSPEELDFGEVQITYLTHACMDLKLGDKRMVFDPWLMGPAFARGWWLLHEPPSDWLERLCQADLIYISHLHSDHLSYPTLKKLAGRRPDIPIYVGNTERPVFWNLNQSGVQLTNINVVPFGIWQQVDKNLRFMILMDGVHPEMDTCIIVEYKGHKILNTVDCTRPNGGRLPMKVALMMSDFAGGASGFPMTFSGGKFTEEWKAQFIKTERKKLLNYKAQLVKNLQPRIYCPFAGYFVESHPSDKYIKETNTKNDPNELNNLIKKNSDVITWTPRPGATLDLGRMLKDPTDSNFQALMNIRITEETHVNPDPWTPFPPRSGFSRSEAEPRNLHVYPCASPKHSGWLESQHCWVSELRQSIGDTQRPSTLTPCKGRKKKM